MGNQGEMSLSSLQNDGQDYSEYTMVRLPTSSILEEESEDYTSLITSDSSAVTSQPKTAFKIPQSETGNEGLERSQLSLQSSRSRSEVCRICHDSGGSEDFISPCSCKGSVSLVHRSCLEHWLAESDSTVCELCGSPLRVQRLPRYSLFRSLGVWLTSSGTRSQRRSLLADCAAMLLLCPALVLSTVLAVQLIDGVLQDDLRQMEQRLRLTGGGERKEGTSSDTSIGKTNTSQNDKGPAVLLGEMLSTIGQMGIISLIITMDMAYFSWVLVKIQYHVGSWYNWYRRSCKVTLVGYPNVRRQQVQESPTPASQVKEGNLPVGAPQTQSEGSEAIQIPLPVESSLT